MQYTPSIGDLLIRPKVLGIISHVGVLVGPNTVLQNTPEKGEHLATVPEFAAGELVKVITTGAPSSNVLARARKIMTNPKPYNPVTRNCEHTATEVLRGLAKSPQLLLYGLLIGIFLLLVIFWPRR